MYLDRFVPRLDVGHGVSEVLPNEYDVSRFVVTISCHLGHTVYSDKKTKASEILSVE